MPKIEAAAPFTRMPMPSLSEIVLPAPWVVPPMVAAHWSQMPSPLLAASELPPQPEIEFPRIVAEVPST